MKEQNKQKGIILYVVLLIISVFMAVVLTLATVSLSQIRIAWQAGDSVKAFAAADTGVERALYNIRNADPLDTSDIGVTGMPISGANYSVDITITGPTTATIQSKGEFKKSRRTIEAKY
ncbi:MAG: pilus assembly PilX N-terminal domain-containing protein [bacterium]